MSDYLHPTGCTHNLCGLFLNSLSDVVKPLQVDIDVVHMRLASYRGACSHVFGKGISVQRPIEAKANRGRNSATSIDTRSHIRMPKHVAHQAQSLLEVWQRCIPATTFSSPEIWTTATYDRQIHRTASALPLPIQDVTALQSLFEFQRLYRS